MLTNLCGLYRESAQESEKLKILEADALVLATTVMDEPVHVPPNMDKSASSAGKAGKTGMAGMAGMSSMSDSAQSAKSAKSAKSGKSGKRLVRRGYADDGQEDQPAEQESESLLAEQVVGHGDRDVLIMRVNYAGATPSYCDEDCVNRNMWTGTNSVDSMYNEVSFGAVRFPANMGQVITVDVPNGAWANSGCKFWEIGLEADEAARAQGIEPNDYTHRSYVIPQSTGGCSFGGLGYVGCSATYCKTWVRQAAGGTLAHELGHNLGVWHSATDYNNDGVEDAEYGDNSDVMGSSTNWRGMNSVHRIVLNWLPTNIIQSYTEAELTCSNDVHKTLVSLSRAYDASVGPSAITFPRIAAGRGTYYVSLRTSNGVDASLAGTWQNKVFVHYHATHSTRFQVNSHLVTTLTAGQSWTETTTGVTVSVSSINANTGVASISYNFCEPGETAPNGPSPTNPPTPTASTCVEATPDKCAIWSESGFCSPEGIYFNYMSINCKVACGFCDAVPPPPTPYPTLVPTTASPTTPPPTTASPTPNPTLSFKDGYAHTEPEDRVVCLDLTNFQAMPECVPGGIP